MTGLGVKVVGINIERKTNLLNIYNPLIFFGLFLSFGLLESELAIVDNISHRRLCLRRNLYKVKITGGGSVQCLLQFHNAELFTVRINHADFLITDFLVDLQFLAADVKHLQIVLPHYNKKHGQFPARAQYKTK